MTWGNPTSWEEVCRRAAARRHYNAVRHFEALQRQTQVAALLGQYGILTHGVQARIARELKVSRATICRDVAALLQAVSWCPRCGGRVPECGLKP
jgi:hypothetical protein